MLTNITTPGQSLPKSKVNERVLLIPQTPRLQSHHQMQFNVIQDTQIFKTGKLLSKTASSFCDLYQTKLS